MNGTEIGWTIFLIIYVIGVIVLPYRVFIALLARRQSHRRLDNDAIAGYIIGSIFVSLIWPLISPLGISYFVWNRTTKFSMEAEFAKMEDKARVASKLIKLREKQRKLAEAQEAETEALINDIMKELNDISGTHENETPHTPQALVKGPRLRARKF